MVFKLNISDAKTGKSYQLEVPEKNNAKLIGKKIGDEIPCEVVGLSGYAFKITGGSDSDGFPMRKGVKGSARKKLLLSGGVGYRQKIKGIKKRKSIRGEVISDKIVQINAVITKYGKQKLEDLKKKPEEQQEQKQ